MAYMKIILKQRAEIGEIRQLVNALANARPYVILSYVALPYISDRIGTDGVPLIKIDYNEKTTDLTPVLRAYRRVIFRAETDEGPITIPEAD